MGKDNLTAQNSRKNGRKATRLATIGSKNCGRGRFSKNKKKSVNGKEKRKSQPHQNPSGEKKQLTRGDRNDCLGKTTEKQKKRS